MLVKWYMQIHHTRFESYAICSHYLLWHQSQQCKFYWFNGQLHLDRKSSAAQILH